MKLSVAGSAGSAAVGEWQLIESAPKDGTYILLWGLWAGEINGPSKEPGFLGEGRSTKNSDWVGFNWALTGGDAYMTWGNPTHWMPLPEPPDAS